MKLNEDMEIEFDIEDEKAIIKLVKENLYSFYLYDNYIEKYSFKDLEISRILTRCGWYYCEIALLNGDDSVEYIKLSDNANKFINGLINEIKIDKEKKQKIDLVERLNMSWKTVVSTLGSGENYES